MNFRYLALIQSYYFLTTGAWPWVHYESFAYVTAVEGPAWAFRSIGLLIMVVGAVLLAGARLREYGTTVVLLGGLSAAALMGIDVYLLRDHVIGPLNGGDVILQFSFAAAWAYLVSRRRPTARDPQ